jgi:hypothetical protein
MERPGIAPGPSFFPLHSIEGQNVKDKNEPAETEYDPYAKDPAPTFSNRDLLNHHKRVNANIAGTEYHEPTEEETEEIEPEKLTVAELKEALDEAGIEYTSEDKKADLVKLYSDYLADNQ